jgi:Fe-S cluster assembly iron-binding protein IscA
MIHLKPGAGEAIRSFLRGKGKDRPVRIELHSTGCCDASLGLLIDDVREADLIQESEGITFLTSSDLSAMAGDIAISYVNETDRKGFVLTSSKPISEWDGFGVTEIRTE